MKISNLKVVQENVSGDKHDAFSEDQNNNRDDEKTVSDIVKEAENRVTENSLKEGDQTNEILNKDENIIHDEEEWVSPNNNRNSESSSETFSGEESEIPDNVDLSQNVDNVFDEKIESKLKAQTAAKENVDISNIESNNNQNLPIDDSISNTKQNMDVSDDVNLPSSNDDANLPSSTIDRLNISPDDNMNSQISEEDKTIVETNENAIHKQYKKEERELTQKNDKLANDDESKLNCSLIFDTVWRIV